MKARWPALGALAAALLCAGLGIYGAVLVRWDDRPWEIASRQIVEGDNPYTLNLESRRSTVEQTGWPYGPLGLYAGVPIYLATRGRDPRPRAFAAVCVLLAVAAHILAGRQAWHLAGPGWRGSAAAALTLLNPFLLRLDASGDILDLPMLLTLLASVRTLQAGRGRLAAAWLGLSLGFKQAALLYLPYFMLRQRRETPVLAAAALLPGLPFLVWDAPAFLFGFGGLFSAYRNFVQLDWWNMFGFYLRAGVPATALRVVSYALTLGGSAAVAASRARPLPALAVTLALAWVTYYSGYSLYLGWWSAVAMIVVAAAL